MTRPFWTLTQQLPRPEPKPLEKLTLCRNGLLLSKAQIEMFKEELPHLARGFDEASEEDAKKIYRVFGYEEDE